MKTNNKLLLAGIASAILLPPQAAAQQGMDMAVLQKWADAKVVRYRVEGVHKARTPVVHGDYEGKGDVTDRITLEYTWDLRKQKPVGAIKVTDGKTEVANLKSDGTNCPPPQLKGEYEHFQHTSHAVQGDLIVLKGTRTYPAASVSNYPASCSMRAIPGAKTDANLGIPASMDPQFLGMPAMQGSPVNVSADRKSYTMQGGEGWSFTVTPTRVE